MTIYWTKSEQVRQALIRATSVNPVSAMQLIEEGCGTDATRLIRFYREVANKDGRRVCDRWEQNDRARWKVYWTEALSVEELAIG